MQQIIARGVVHLVADVDPSQLDPVGLTVHRDEHRGQRRLGELGQRGVGGARPSLDPPGRTTTIVLSGAATSPPRPTPATASGRVVVEHARPIRRVGALESDAAGH